MAKRKNKIVTSDELSGLLNQAIFGLNRLVENKKFSTTEGSEDVKQRWIRKSNSFVAFCFDCIEDNYDGRIAKKELRKKYSSYCKLHKISVKSDWVVKKVLQENYGSTEIYGREGELRNDSWEGVSWKV